MINDLITNSDRTKNATLRSVEQVIVGVTLQENYTDKPIKMIEEPTEFEQIEIAEINSALSYMTFSMVEVPKIGDLIIGDDGFTFKIYAVKKRSTFYKALGEQYGEQNGS